LRRIDGIDEALMAELGRMRADMYKVLSEPNAEDSISIRAVMMPYGRRALVVAFLAATLGGVFYRAVNRVRWLRAAMNGAAAAVFTLAFAWVITGLDGLWLLVVPVLLFGVPGALWALAARRDGRGSLRVLAAWAAAAAPALLLTRAWF
jgi:hypothetical protein